MLYTITKSWRQLKAQERRIILGLCNVTQLELPTSHHLLPLMVSVARGSDGMERRGPISASWGFGPQLENLKAGII